MDNSSAAINHLKTNQSSTLHNLTFTIVEGGMDAARLAVLSGKYYQPNKRFLLLFISEK